MSRARRSSAEAHHCVPVDHRVFPLPRDRVARRSTGADRGQQAVPLEALQGQAKGQRLAGWQHVVACTCQGWVVKVPVGLAACELYHKDKQRLQCVSSFCACSQRCT